MSWREAGKLYQNLSMETFNLVEDPKLMIISYFILKMSPKSEIFHERRSWLLSLSAGLAGRAPPCSLPAPLALPTSTAPPRIPHRSHPPTRHISHKMVPCTHGTHAPAHAQWPRRSLPTGATPEGRDKGLSYSLQMAGWFVSRQNFWSSVVRFV